MTPDASAVLGFLLLSLFVAWVAEITCGSEVIR